MATRAGARRERTAGPIEEAVIELALHGYTPVQIAQVLPGTVKAIAEIEGWKTSKVPSLRTIQRIARQAKPRDQSGDWAIEHSSPEDARTVLSFLAEAIVETDGRVASVTREQADWLVRLRPLGPPTGFGPTLRLVALYQERRSHGRPSDDLDAFLGFAPWSGRLAAIRYFRAVLERHIRPAPLWLIEDPSVEMARMDARMVIEALAVPRGESLKYVDEFDRPHIDEFNDQYFLKHLEELEREELTRES